MTRPARPWAAIVESIAQARRREPAGLSHRAFVDRLWEHLEETGVSWLGIYLADPLPPAGPATQLLLGARRDKPACSPIGLHGVCGRCLVEERAIVIEDVLALGDAYVACDPRDRSEAVVPLQSGGTAWGVLDLDSHEVGAFSDADLAGLAEAVGAAGLRPKHP